MMEFFHVDFFKTSQVRYFVQNLESDASVESLLFLRRCHTSLWDFNFFTAGLSSENYLYRIAFRKTIYCINGSVNPIIITAFLFFNIFVFMSFQKYRLVRS